MADETPQPQPAPAPEPGSAEWLEQKTAESEKPAPTAETAVPAVTQPQDTVEPWWESGFADAKHGFLKGRKGPEVEHAFRATEAEMRRAQLEAKAVKEEAERARADAAAARLALQMAAEQRQAQQVDPTQEVEKIFFEQGPAAGFAKFKELTAKEVQAEAARVVSQQLQQYQQQQSDQARTYQTVSRLSTAKEAAERARAGLNVDQAVWENERGLAVAAKIISLHGNDGLTVEKNWADAYNSLYQPQGAPVVVAAAPVVANPPGSKTAASIQSAPNAGLPTLRDEERKGYEQIAQIAGLDPDQFIARLQKRQGGTRA